MATAEQAVADRADAPALGGRAGSKSDDTDSVESGTTVDGVAVRPQLDRFGG